jgi:Ca2+-binding EF-hand superfamily protein
MFDTDAGGTIDVSELPLLLKAFKCGDLNDPHTQAMIAAVDVDADGEISVAEFTNLMAILKANTKKKAQKP